MADTHTVLDAIIDSAPTGGKIVVQFSSKQEYETLRTRLVTLWSKHRQTIIDIVGEDGDPLVVYSLCSNWASDTREGSFFLGKPRRKLAKTYSFKIVEEHAPFPTPTVTITTADPANDDAADSDTTIGENHALPVATGTD